MNPSSPRNQWTVQEIADALQGTVHGDTETLLSGAASVEEAEPGDLVFAESPRFLAAALRSRASAVLTSAELAVSASGKPLVLVSNPRLAFVKVLEMLAPPLAVPPGIDAGAQIAATAQLGAGVRIGANVTVGESVILGDRVILMPGTRVGDGCVIGEDTVLHPNVVFYPGVKTGRRCIFHAGCVIGADGFGYVPVGYALKKVPHSGVVEIGDEVEVGANTCIDRAKTGATVIGSGTKIDNLVHVAHNVRIGQSCLLIAQVGIAGSVTLGNGVVLAGQAGVKDHVSLGDGVRVGGQGGVIGDVPPGVTVSGYPARPHKEKMREYAASSSLPDYIKRIRSLEKRLAELEARLGTGAESAGDPGKPVLAQDEDGTGYEQKPGQTQDVGPVG